MAAARTDHLSIRAARGTLLHPSRHNPKRAVYAPTVFGGMAKAETPPLSRRSTSPRFGNRASPHPIRLPYIGFDKSGEGCHSAPSAVRCICGDTGAPARVEKRTARAQLPSIGGDENCHTSSNRSGNPRPVRLLSVGRPDAPLTPEEALAPADGEVGISPRPNK